MKGPAGTNVSPKSNVLRVAFEIYAALLVLGIFAIGSLSRFTWWGIIVQLIFATAVLFRVHWRIYLFVVLLQTVIVLGVLVMSGARCALFLKSLEEEGAAIYFYGTFVLHYAPLVLSVFAYTPRWREGALLTQTLAAASVFGLYCIAQNPVKVYECGTLQEELPVALGIGGAIVIGTVAIFVASF